ncbi:aspartic proteinase nepenthesin-1-like [Carica papaya]|uniref:aspartic proteinase nepenthesin-1-like n=1 Tax=Carica papaya TaxID=3649 RepID=UPI000B8CD90A|nr:aspartic proteinase nepenthesin-1-like [Carica papaya]
MNAQTNAGGADFQPDFIAPWVLTDMFVYYLELNIGTPGRRLLLVLDTGSGITWIQCKPCIECFPQKDGVFDPNLSSSYRKINCNHPLCSSCVDGECHYTSHYLSGQLTGGVYSTETFNFQDIKGSDIKYHNVLMGCSHKNRKFSFGENNVAGIVGMDMTPYSLVRQLGIFVQNRFSYCFPTVSPEGRYLPTLLKFGLDVGYRGGDVKTTPIITHKNTGRYGLNLLDISIADKRMNFPPGTFSLTRSGTGGFVIDSGSTMTYIDSKVYWKIHAEFVAYFEVLGLERFRRKDCIEKLTLCYDMPDIDFNKFPLMTYHFEGGDLVVAAENSFFIDWEEKMFALTILPIKQFNILGAWQQRNTRFVYDLNSKLLWFVPERCGIRE